MTTQTYSVSNQILAGHRAQAFTETEKPYPLMFITPIDLQAEDRCTVIIESGYLLAIERDGEVIWKSWEKDTK
jgi:hypothetical protein